MNLDLFAAGFLAAMGVITASFITYLITRYVEYKGRGSSKKAIKDRAAWRKKQIKNFSYSTGGAVAAAVLIGFLLSWWDPSDKLPQDIWLMVLPTTISSILLTAYIRRKHKKHIVVSATALVLSVLFGLLLVNNYYRYYPTLYSVIGIQNRIKVIADRHSTTFEYTKDHSAAPVGSIENDLYGPNFSPKGTIESVRIPGKVSKFNARDGWLYVPRIAGGKTAVDLPVIVLMAGTPGAPTDWLNGGGLQATLDTYATVHHGITPMVFVLDENGSQLNDTECVDSARGNVETYLSVDVPTYIKSHFNVSTTPDHWAIGGLSLGGLCGVMLALRHQDTFHYFLDFGGESAPEIGSEDKTITGLFNGSQAEYQAHIPMNLLLGHKYPNMGGFFAIGKSDNPKTVDNLQSLYQLTKQSDMNSVLEMIGGEHTFNVWQQSFKDALPWIANQLGSDNCTTACH
ncbi:MAG: alpha/beta hydrolase [Candidatus Saccharibacteria bacterium]